MWLTMVKQPWFLGMVKPRGSTVVQRRVRTMWFTMVKQPWFFGYGKTTWFYRGSAARENHVVHHGRTTWFYHTQKTMVFYRGWTMVFSR